MDDIRINARLTGDDARQFMELQRREGNRSASDLLRDALREYYAAHVKPRAGAFETMTASGFIGGGDGARDLSTNYKEILKQSLARKHPLRVSEPRPAYRAPRRK